MKLWWFTFGILVVTCVLVAAVALGTDSAGGSGVKHPTMPAMNAGGDASRHDSLALPAFLYGSLLITLLVVLMKPGIRPGQPGWSLLAIVGGLCIVALAGVFLLYEESKGSTPDSLILGFPPATALMLYVLWPLPIAVVILYALKFDQWILSPDEHDQFQQRLTRTEHDER